MKKNNKKYTILLLYKALFNKIKVLTYLKISHTSQIYTRSLWHICNVPSKKNTDEKQCLSYKIIVKIPGNDTHTHAHIHTMGSHFCGVDIVYIFALITIASLCIERNIRSQWTVSYWQSTKKYTLDRRLKVAWLLQLNEVTKHFFN